MPEMNQDFYDDIENIDFQAYLYNQINSILIRFQVFLPVPSRIILNFKLYLNFGAKN